MKTIFIQIASYRDPELIPTINNLIDNAKHPERLTLCINWQHADDETIDIFKDYNTTGNGSIRGFTVLGFEHKKANLKVIDLDYKKARGACWARHMIQELYDGEDYTLQLDSHHRFVKHWDMLAIDMLESVRDESPKPILTAYLPSFDPDNDPDGRTQEVWKMNFDRFIPEGAVFFMPSAVPNWKSLDKPIKTRFYSGHFTFADGSFAAEVKHDPEYFFHGEEISLAVRAFTHGYDLYHPHRIIAWHEYTRKYRTKVWDDHTSKEKDNGEIEYDWLERNNMCHARNRILFGMDGENPNQIDFGEYGFGTERTLEDYEKFSGISFKYRGAQKATVDGELPPNNQDGIDTEEKWNKSLMRSNDIRICIHRSEIGEIVDDFDFFYVGAHDERGKEIYRKDLHKDEIYQHLENEFIDYQFIFMADINTVPHSYVIWTHSKSKGWLKRIVKKIQ